MPSTLDIRRRIRSVKNTAQITKAMQMVAAAKMRRAQSAALAGHPYSQVLTKVLSSLRPRVDPRSHDLLQVREVRRELIVLFSTDKGLCGALNSNLFRELLNVDSQASSYVAVGRKGVQFLARTRRQLVAEFQIGDPPQFREVRVIGRFCMDRFSSREVDQVRVLYPRFVNTLTQQPVLRTLLPIPAEGLGKDGQTPAPAASAPATATAAAAPTEYPYDFEPNEGAVLSAILPHYVNFQLFQLALDTRASEHSARMVAMKNATDNAKQLVKDLTLEYNKARQANITTELLEIVTAQLAVQ
ncbi:MAG: ATP synthase F1 subunit gamma [Verrucomicrobia bacterium]|nr:ATP synthase F1 subunit gamma [Verrucomicrobiota bacterium]